MAAAISLYLDENLSPKIAQQLRRRGINVVSVQEMGLEGDDDANHLTRAVAMGCALVTADSDFLIMAASGIEHNGILFGVQDNLSIGDWIERLELVCAVYSPEELINHVEYL